MEAVEDTRIVAIQVTDADPERAATIANRLADEYIAKTLEDRSGSTDLAEETLGEQSDELRTRLNQSELALHHFKQEHNVLSVSMEDRQNILAADIVHHNTKLQEARSRRRQLEARASRIRALVSGNDVDAGSTLSYGIQGGTDDGATVTFVGAFGTLTITHDITRYTKAAAFSHIGKKTDMLLRFSTVAGERGAADAERDVRGWALKFYTDEGNWDLVGNNTPVFFVRDPLKFPDFIHTQKRDPRTNMRSATAMWDFWSLSPESLHQVTILFSDRGLPKNYRQMHGFGSHTYSFINAQNERVWVKFHFKSMQGIANITEAESAAVIGGTARAISATFTRRSSAASSRAGA